MKAPETGVGRAVFYVNGNTGLINDGNIIDRSNRRAVGGKINCNGRITIRRPRLCRIIGSPSQDYGSDSLLSQRGASVIVRAASRENAGQQSNKSELSFHIKRCAMIKLVNDQTRRRAPRARAAGIVNSAD